MKHLFQTELVLLMITYLSMCNTRTVYPPTGLISELADLLHFDRVELFCTHESDQGMQVTIDILLGSHNLSATEKYPRHPFKSIVVVPTNPPEECMSLWNLTQQKAISRDHALLISANNFNLLSFKPTMLHEVYLYNMSDASRVTLNEVYSVMQGPLIEQHIGQYTKQGGLIMEEPCIWQRRRDLGGVQLRNIITTSGRSSYFLRDGNGTITGSAGQFQDILNILKGKLNFTVKTFPSIDGKFGSPDPETGEWNGMVGMLVRNEADICSSDVTMTVERSEVVIDFSHGLWLDVVTMTVARSNAKKINLLAYLQIFSGEVWICFAVSIAMLTIGTRLVAHLSGDRFHNPTDPEEFTLDNAFASVAITFLQNEYGFESKRKLTTKVLFFVTCLFSYLLITSYVGVLTSFLTVTSSWVPLESFKDAFDKDFRILVWASSAHYDDMRTAAPGTALKKLFNDRVKDNPDALVSGPLEAADRLAEEGENTAYFGGGYIFAEGCSHCGIFQM